MSPFYDWPKAARFGRVIPKTKLYEHGASGARLKQKFVDQVERIRWAYKLAPETINLPAASGVTEIQVFEIETRQPNIDTDILAAIDKAISFPILFELVHEARRSLMAAWKRPSEADKSKWVTSGYFGNDWTPEPVDRAPLPVALNIAALYQALVRPLIPASPRDGESLTNLVARADAIAAKEREIERIKSRLAREKQFNLRLAINDELRKANKDLAELTGRT